MLAPATHKHSGPCCVGHETLHLLYIIAIYQPLVNETRRDVNSSEGKGRRAVAARAKLRAAESIVEEIITSIILSITEDENAEAEGYRHWKFYRRSTSKGSVGAAQGVKRRFCFPDGSTG